MCPGVDPASEKWVPGISPGVKAVGANGWLPTTLVVPNVKKIRCLNRPGTHWACSGLLRDDLYLYVIYRSYRRLDVAAEIGACVTESNRQCTPKTCLLLTWWIACRVTWIKRTQLNFILSFLSSLYCLRNLVCHSCTSEWCEAFLEVWQHVDL